MPTLEEKLKDVFAQQLNIAAADVSDAASPSTVAAWDSLKHVELILAIEDAFGVVFDAAEVFGLTSFGGILAQLGAKLGAAPAIAR
jgi:acyl carrier protein